MGQKNPRKELEKRGKMGGGGERDFDITGT